MTSKKKINAARAADLMRSGALLARMHDRDGLRWFLVANGGNGGAISEKIALELLSRPDVQPNDDGLFPGLSQTFRLGAAS